MRRMFLVVAIGLSFALAGPASALTVTETGSEELVLEWTDCTDATPVCTLVRLVVVDAEDARGSEACLDILTLEPTGEFIANVLAMETGCAAIDPADLALADKLSSATLAATSIDLTYCDNTVDPPACEPSRTVTVSATAVATSGQGRFAQALPFPLNPLPDACEVIRVMLAGRAVTGQLTVDSVTYTATGSVLTGTRTEMAVTC